MKQILVQAEKPYTVSIGPGLLKDCGAALREVADSCRVMLVTDSTVESLYAPLVINSLREAGFEVDIFSFPEGERSKNMKTLSRLLEKMAEVPLTRADCVTALGGGVVGDLAGFAAGCFLRGIRFVQLPTTLLAAVDSSVGGKTAVDLAAGKNLAGLFWQPAAVICDTDCLATLPEETFLGGAAEAIKTAILSGEDFFSLLEKDSFEENIPDIIARSVAFKAGVVEEDERESGLRKTLNLGHTIGHAIERCSGYELPHGQAVSIGLAMMTRAALRAGDCVPADGARILRLLREKGLPTQTEYSTQPLFEAALRDKKRSGDKITLVWPRAIGDCVLRELPAEDLREIIESGRGEDPK